MALRRAGIEDKWNEAVVASVALADRIGRMRVHDISGFAVKLRALACEWEDDLEDHRLGRLYELAREMAVRHR